MILLFCPTYRLEPETRAAIFGQEYDEPVDRFFTRDNPFGQADGGKANILYNYRKVRRLVLAGEWDALVVVESDIIPPDNALADLTAELACADVVYGLYLFRRGAPYPVNVLHPVTGRPIDQEGDYLHFHWGDVIDCQGSGLGCTAIRREVLEDIEFRDGSNHCDTQFTQDLRRRGYQMRADLSVICGHKTPNGLILWPSRSDPPEISEGVTEGFRGVTDGDPTEEHERRARAWRAKMAVENQKPYMIYVGGGAYMPGVPMRDLTRAEWETLPEGVCAACEKLYRIKKTKSAKSAKSKGEK